MRSRFVLSAVAKLAGRMIVSVVLLTTIFGCRKSTANVLQGYVEGEFVYVACATAGRLQTLSVARGEAVQPGTKLFEIENVAEQAARDEAARRVAQAQATLADLGKGQRPSELQALEAQLAQAQAALVFSTKELDRQTESAKARATSAQDLDRARASQEQDQQRVAQIIAQLKTARLGQREDQLAAGEANVKATQAALVRAQWELDQRAQSAVQSGVVFDTLYRPGEWVPAGKPVVSILPPAYVKVRAFVPQDRIGNVQTGDKVSVTLDGVAGTYSGTVAFISPNVEYTPPVIYGQENRGKLVIMIEIVFDAQTAAKLHPGQPVDVNLKP